MAWRELKGASKRKKNWLAFRAGILLFGIPAALVALGLLVGAYITNTMADDFSRRLARQYSVEAASNFLTATNSHFVLAQQLAHSTTISRWMVHGDDEEIRSRAIEEIMGYAAFAPHIFLMFSSDNTSDVYDLRIGFTEEDFVPWWQIDMDNDLWYINTRDAELPFNINIQRSRPVDGQWDVYVWTNHRMYYEGRFVGVVTAGSPFQAVFDAVFEDYEIDTRRGYIIDYNGLARADSAGLLKVLDEGISHPAVMPEAADNAALAAGISRHLRSMVDGAFIGGEICEAIPLEGDFRYASIASIAGTNWSVVVLSDQDDVLGGLLTPLFTAVLSILVVAIVIGNLLIRHIAIVPLYRLTQSTESVGTDEDSELYGLERNDEIGDLARTINNALIAEESNKAKSRFLARMSHELRTPITAVLGISEIQLRSPALPPEMDEAFGRIYDSSQMLLNIVNDILDFSKIESGKMTIVEGSYDVSNLVIDAAQFHMVRLEHRNISFQLQVDERLPTHLTGDVLRIQQIINNVISNAFKYTEAGSVLLSFGCENRQEDSIYLTITIKDTGLGMSKDQLDTIKTGEYTRFHEQDVRFTSGTGLGIPIVYSLVEIMNGQIDYKSEVGKGTAVIISIPQKISGTETLGSEAAARLQNFETHTRQTAKKFKFVPEPMPYGKVLVVDDVDANLFVAQGLLAFYGITVETCSHGRGALKKIEQGMVYDIVFMDHLMPDLNGIETMRIMRDMGYNHPIVALTAGALVGQSEEFIKIGFDGFVSKPIQTMELNDTLLKFIRDKQPPEVIAKAKAEAKAKSSAGIDEFLTSTDTLKKLRNDFRKSHKKAFQGITKALDEGDIEAAHRIAHNIKSSAGLIGEDALVQIAEVMEGLLRADKVPGDVQLSTFENELSRVLDNISLPVSKRHLSDTSRADIVSLLDKLEPLLKSSDAKCLDYLDKLRPIPEAAIIALQIENFDFELAGKSLDVLRQIFEE